MAIDSDKERIFELWYDYDHASGADEKGSAKVKRNTAIKEVLNQKGMDDDVSGFLRCFFSDYKEWLRSTGNTRGGGRRY